MNEPHKLDPEAFEEAVAVGWGVVIGSRMAGVPVPQFDGPTHEVFRTIVAEAFDAGYRARETEQWRDQEAPDMQWRQP